MNNDIITQWANNETHIENPWLVYISITNICNSKCNFCAHSSSMRPEKGIMHLELLKKIVDQLPVSVKKIYLQKQGEPFLNKYLPSIVQYIKEKRPDIHIALHTNCVVMTRKKIIEVLPYIDSMGVSVSAVSPEVYSKIHGVDKFSLVENNLKDLSELILDLPKEKRPYVFVDYVKCKDNSLEEKDIVIQFYKDNFPGISSVDFHVMYNFQGEIEEGNLEIYEKLPYDKFPCCVFPWSSITFCHDGLVSYCFVEPRENLFLGDINKQTFDEIWNSEEYRVFRKRMTKKRFNVLAKDGFYCHKCSWLWSMHSQSPRNLNYGYSAKPKERYENVKFSDLLNLPFDRVFEMGIYYYLKGEIHLAIGCFQLLLLHNTRNESLINRASEMIEKCNNVLIKYKDFSLWQETMREEGRAPENNLNKYCNIGGN